MKNPQQPAGRPSGEHLSVPTGTAGARPAAPRPGGRAARGRFGEGGAQPRGPSSPPQPSGCVNVISRRAPGAVLLAKTAFSSLADQDSRILGFCL